MKRSFGKCSSCGEQWRTKDEFMSDGNVRLDGYRWDGRQVRNGLPPEGVLVFIHATTACGSAITVAANSFRRAS